MTPAASQACLLGAAKANRGKVLDGGGGLAKVHGAPLGQQQQLVKHL